MSDDLYAVEYPSDEADYFERVDHWRADVPEGLRGLYDDMLGRNVAPNVAAAVVRYVAGVAGDASRETQSDVAIAYGIRSYTIRNWLTDDETAAMIESHVDWPEELRGWKRPPDERPVNPIEW